MKKAKNTSLNKANKAKEDEFYTQLPDIENELKHYKHHFKDKVVLLNCDDPQESNFWKYFYLNFEHLGLKKLIATHYDPEKPTYKLELERGQTEPVKTPLKQNGDFRSPECIELLKEADIVCTNPPFSLFREYVAQLVEYNKKFLIIGSQNNITYKDVFPLVKNNALWLGYGFNGGNAYFRIPEGREVNYAKGVFDQKTGLVKFRNCTWFTNLLHDKRNEELLTVKRYTPEEYPTYDNYNAIEVSKVAEIPKDYYGLMGVPITFMSQYNPNQFEICGLTTGRKEFDEISWPTKRYINAIQYNKNGSTTNGSKANTRATLRLKEAPKDRVYYSAENIDYPLAIVYARVLIRRKKNEN